LEHVNTKKKKIAISQHKHMKAGAPVEKMLKALRPKDMIPFAAILAKGESWRTYMLPTGPEGIKT